MPSTSHHSDNPERHLLVWLTGRRLAFLYFIAACLVFGPLYNAGFVTDFTGWLECRETTPFWNAYQCFGNRGLYFVPFIILELLTSLFWLHPLPWFIVWTGMHALNAYLVSDVCKRLLTAFDVSLSPAVPVIAGVIFLLHPWQVEVVAWKACVNYLAACMLMLMTLRGYLQWLGQGKYRYYWIALASYVGFLFTLEFALLFPLILFVLHWTLFRKLSLSRRIAKIAMTITPFFAAIGIWLLANKSLIGIWIGHYGAETHLSLDFVSMSSTVLKYLVKIFAFSRSYSFEFQTQLYGALDHPAVGLTMIGLFIALAISTIALRPKGSGGWWLRMCIFIAGLICIVPVSNLYFYYLQYSENDRYTYLAIAFFAMWLPIVLWQWKKWLGKGLVIVLILACLWNTRTLVNVWEKSTEAYWHHVKTFPEPQKSKIFLLNVPDNYQGTFMFRNIGGDSAFEDVWKWIARSEYSGKMYDVFQYNMTSLDNDFIVSWESENKLKVEFAEWGSWWWRNGVGGERYSNEEYTAWPEGKYYFVEFKKSLEDSEIWYYRPDGWRQVPLNENK